ncbi:hypothetical protein D3C81_1113930 [compost metagenome]
MSVADALNQRHSDNLGDGRRGTDGDHAAKRGTTAGYRGTDGLELVHDSGGPFKNLEAGSGDFHTAAMPLEQVDAQFLFQLPNLPAQCRLRHMEPVRSLAQAAKFGHMDQGFQLHYVHRSTTGKERGASEGRFSQSKDSLEHQL